MAKTTHGDSRTKFYQRWCSMIQRCENPNIPCYVHYGGRGITVCDEWHDYATFKKWALENGFNESLTIDRIDVDGNYEPSNCRWVTRKVQESNKRPDSRKALWKPIEAIDEKGNVVKRFKCTSDACKWLGVKQRSIPSVFAVLRGERNRAYGYGWKYADVES